MTHRFGIDRADKRGHMPRSILLPAAIFILVLSCSACGSGSGDLNVTITDGYCSTLITASAGETVASVLSRAEITLSEDDTSIPESDETITEDQTTITIGRNAQVSVTDGDQVTELELVGATVSDAIEEAGITLGEHDIVNHDPDAYLTDGMEITVEHWYEVSVLLSGEEQSVVTQAATVELLLEELGISVTEEDRVSPGVDTAIDSDGLEVEVQYVSTREITVETTIPYETVYEDSDTLYVGETEVAQEGQDGIQETTYLVTYIDGVEESRRVTGTAVTQEAVDEIILTGTKEEEPSEQEQESQSESDLYSDDGRRIVSKEAIYDCDGSGNGYYVIEYEDGTIEYEDFYDPDFW